jgi:predicted dithiol-disulfide oxidoreductase (DUF899 family)
MTTHKIGTREEWLAARTELLAAEKEHTRRGDELARQRRELPWVPIDKEYRFETETGTKSLAELFDERSQLLVYHFMFGPDYEAGCPACSSIADGFNGLVPHLANRDVTMLCVSRAPLAKLLAYRERMGWSFPWVSSGGSDFNYDFTASFTHEQLRATGGEYNFRPFPNMAPMLEADAGPVPAHASSCETTPAHYLEEAPGMSAFVLSDGVVHHTYSAYARGLDGLWGAYQWLDRTPFGRADSDPAGVWTRKDEYDRVGAA